MLAEQAAAFRQKFGREPGPNDPLVFDPEADEPQPMPVENIEAATVEAMRSAGLDDAYIYAYQVTGLMPTEMNRHLLTDDDIAEFEEAIAKYQALHER